MNRDVGLAWVAALRSGDYQQGHHSLAQRLDAVETTDVTPTYRYCCLGVLCELAVAAGVPVTVSTVGDGSLRTFDGNENYTPPAVIAWAGMSMGDGDPVVDRDDAPDGDDGVRLSDLNDIHRWTFDRIASVIEAQLLDPEEPR